MRSHISFNVGLGGRSGEYGERGPAALILMLILGRRRQQDQTELRRLFDKRKLVGIMLCKHPLGEPQVSLGVAVGATFNAG